MSLTDTPTRADWVQSALDQHEAALLRYAVSITGDLETARDVVQDTFLRLCEQDPGQIGDRVAPWLFTVCRNRVVDIRRKEQRMSPLSEIDLEREEAGGPDPAGAAEMSEGAGLVLSFLQQLPPNQREVVRLKFQGQLSYEEISRATSLSVGNVGFLLHTALKTLRHRMERMERSGRPGFGTGIG